MDIPSIIFLVVRVIHALAAAIWVGGGLVVLIAIMPVLRSEEEGVSQKLVSVVAGRFGAFVGHAIGVFVLTGGLLTFERLAQPGVTLAYASFLSIKIVLALFAFGLVWRSGVWLEGWEARPINSLVRSGRTSKAGLAVLTGVVIYLLSILLGYLFEKSLPDL